MLPRVILLCLFAHTACTAPTTGGRGSTDAVDYARLLKNAGFSNSHLPVHKDHGISPFRSFATQTALDKGDPVEENEPKLDSVDWMRGFRCSTNAIHECHVPPSSQPPEISPSEGTVEGQDEVTEETAELLKDDSVPGQTADEPISQLEIEPVAEQPVATVEQKILSVTPSMNVLTITLNSALMNKRAASKFSGCGLEVAFRCRWELECKSIGSKHLRFKAGVVAGADDERALEFLISVTPGMQYAVSLKLVKMGMSKTVSRAVVSSF